MKLAIFIFLCLSLSANAQENYTLSNYPSMSLETPEEIKFDMLVNSIPHVITTVATERPLIETLKINQHTIHPTLKALTLGEYEKLMKGEMSDDSEKKTSLPVNKLKVNFNNNPNEK